MLEEMLDLTGLKCPLPAFLARRALAHCAPGQIMEIAASDPLSAVDIPHMCMEEGHAVESIRRAPDRTVFRVRRGP